jgi:antitoxin CcdA
MNLRRQGQPDSIYDLGAPKKATNLSINRDLLEKARDCGINLSAVLEETLIATLQREHRKRWLEENREAIETYNRFVDEYGVFSDGLRSF